MARRKHSKIDGLPDNLRLAVEQMMQSDFTYQEIAEYIHDNGFEISITSIFRHAKTLNATLRDLHMAQENFRVILEEINRYPQLDTTESIVRLLSHRVLEAIRVMPENKWEDIDPAKLIKEASALIRAAAYKNNVDIKNMDILEAGYEQTKTMFFEEMSKSDPELYARVSKYFSAKSEAE